MSALARYLTRPPTLGDAIVWLVLVPTVCLIAIGLVLTGVTA